MGLRILWVGMADLVGLIKSSIRRWQFNKFRQQLEQLAVTPLNQFLPLPQNDCLRNSANLALNLSTQVHFPFYKDIYIKYSHISYISSISFPQLHNHEFVEVCMKILYQVELQRTTLEQMWGFSVEAELIENAERQDELCCYVSRVEDKSVAMHNGEYKRKGRVLCL